MHVMRDCPFALQVWAKSAQGMEFFQSQEPMRRLQEFSVVQRGSSDALQQGTDFLSTTWHI